MKVSNTWRPVLSEEIANTCIPTKSIQICVEHLQKYSPSNKAVRLFKYNAPSTSASANEDTLMPTASSLSSLYSKCPNNNATKEKDLPTSVSKLIHIDLKQLTRGSSFDGSVFAATGRNTKSNLPQIPTEKTPKKCTHSSEPPIVSSHQKANFCTSTPKHVAIVNNVVYSPMDEKKAKPAFSTPVKIFSPRMVLQKLSKKGPPDFQQDKTVSTKNVQLPTSLATLRITNKNKNPLMLNSKSEIKDSVFKEGRTQTKTQIRARLDIPKYKLNCILNNKELPVLNLPHKHSTYLQRSEQKISDSYKKRDMQAFNEQISKFHALHELIKVLREQKRSYPENTFLQQLHKKLKKDKCHFNMARLQKLKEVNASSTNQSDPRDPHVKDQKPGFCRLKNFCSKVQPYSIVDRPAKNDICTLDTNLASSANFKQNNSEPIGRDEQEKNIPLHSTAHPNDLRRCALRGHIKLSSSNGRLFNNIHLKQKTAAKKGFIIDDLKINLIDLEKKIRKYTRKRITPLCEEGGFERNKFNKMSRENSKDQDGCSVVGRSSNSDDNGTSTSHEYTGSSNTRAQFRMNRMRKHTSVSLPDSLVFKKQASSFSTKLPSDKKNYKTLENTILVKGCFNDRQLKSMQCSSKDSSLHQQKPFSKERALAQSLVNLDSKLDYNRKQATRLKNTPYRVNNLPTKNCTANDTASKLTRRHDNSSGTAHQGCSSTEASKSQEENPSAISPRQMYSKDTVKAFTFRSQSFYSDYEHRKFRQF